MLFQTESKGGRIAPPRTHRNEFPAGYSWRVALQQSPLPLRRPEPFCQTHASLASSSQRMEIVPLRTCLTDGVQCSGVSRRYRLSRTHSRLSHRVLHAHHVYFAVCHFAQGGIKRRGFAGARRPRDHEDPIAIGQQLPNALQLVLGRTDVVERAVAFRLHHADDEFLGASRGHR